MNISRVTYMAKPDLAEVKRKIALNEYQNGDFNALQNHFDILEQAMSELLVDPEYLPLSIAFNFLNKVKSQIYNDYWQKEVPIKVGYLIAKLINNFPDVHWAQAMASVGSGATGIGSTASMAVVLKSIHAYGNPLSDIFNIHSASNAIETLYKSNSLLKVDRYKLQMNQMRAGYGLEPEYAEPLDWSTPDAVNNILKTLKLLQDDHRMSTTTFNNALKLSAVTSLFMPAIYDYLFDSVRERWPSLDENEKAWILFSDLMLFNTVAVTAPDNAEALNKSAVMALTLEKYRDYTELPESLRDSKRLEYLKAKYENLFTDSQLTYVNTYLTLINQHFVSVPKLKSLMEEANLTPISATTTPTF